MNGLWQTILTDLSAHWKVIDAFLGVLAVAAISVLPELRPKTIDDWYAFIRHALQTAIPAARMANQPQVRIQTSETTPTGTKVEGLHLSGPFSDSGDPGPTPEVALETDMASFKSFLSAVGHDFVSVFHWIGSAQGQQVIQGGESAALIIGTAINPAIGAAIGGVETLFNLGLKGVLSMEASAAAVGAQSGTGTQKASAVIATLVPQAFALLKQLGVNNPTEQEAEALATAISNGIVTMLNAIPAPSTPAA